MQKIFASKTSSQLAEMYKGIQAKLKKGGPIDVSYWENVSQQVSYSDLRLKIVWLKIGYLYFRLACVCQ